MIDHTQVKSKLQDYLEKLLSDHERQEIDSHISVCSECREELDALKKLVLHLDAIPVLEAPNELTGLIMAEVQKSSSKISIWNTLRSWLPKLGYAYGIGLILISLIGYGMYRTLQNISIVEIFIRLLDKVSTGFANVCQWVVGFWIAGSSLVRLSLPTITTGLMIETMLILAGISFWYFRKQKAMHLLAIE